MFKYNLCQDFRYGKIIFNLLDKYIGKSLHLYGEFSQGEADLFTQIIKEGDVLVEAGANIGAHTVHLAQLVGETGRVYAFEPQRLVFQTLCGNLALNSLPNVFAYQEALGAEPGTLMVPCLSVDVPHNWGGVSLVNATSGDKVQVRTIDSLGLEKCAFIKVDVEGMEWAVLEGAASTITRLRPLLYVELDSGDQYDDQLVANIKKMGYRVYKHKPTLFSADNYFHNSKNLLTKTVKNAQGQQVEAWIVSVNVLCIPEEKPISVVDMEKL